jgi:hypothetical protein
MSDSRFKYRPNIGIHIGYIFILVAMAYWSVIQGDGEVPLRGSAIIPEGAGRYFWMPVAVFCYLVAGVIFVTVLVNIYRYARYGVAYIVVDAMSIYIPPRGLSRAQYTLFSEIWDAKFMGRKAFSNSLFSAHNKKSFHLSSLDFVEKSDYEAVVALLRQKMSGRDGYIF